MKEIKLGLCPGTDIEDASVEASMLARQKKCRVKMDFNGVYLFATPKKSPVTIGWEYDLALGRQSSAYNASAEGQRNRAQEMANAESRQKAVDTWQLIFKDVLAQGLDNTLGWFSNVAPLALGGAKLDYTYLVGMLESHGYKEDENTGQSEEFYLVKENFGRYIIGQVLSFLKRKMPPHQRVISFCETYEEMRRAEMAQRN